MHSSLQLRLPNLYRYDNEHSMWKRSPAQALENITQRFPGIFYNVKSRVLISPSSPYLQFFENTAECAESGNSEPISKDLNKRTGCPLYITWRTILFYRSWIKNSAGFQKDN